MPGEFPLVCAAVLHCGLNPDGSAKQLLRDTLDSLVRMTYPNTRLIVIDNGSTDGSQDMMRKYYPSVELIENGKNLGVMEGYNVGLRYGLQQKADWVLLLNNDPEMLTQLMSVGIGDAKIGILGPKTYFYSEPNKFWYAGGNINFFTGIISHRGIREIDHGQYDETEETDYVNGCAMLVRREVIETIGFLDMIFHPMYSEDADYSLRAHAAGYKLMYVPGAKLWHRVSAFSGGGTTPLKTRYKVEHNFIVLKRYAQWYHWLTIPWCVGVGIIIFVSKELLRGNIKVITSFFQGLFSTVRKTID
jgi:GT2 family glycosyltransferase